MTRTLTRSYENYSDAETAVTRLEAAGVSSDDISIIGYNTADVADDTAVGAEAGGVVGGSAGLLAGLAALPIPGVGPVLAAGRIFGTLAVGATAGAAAGSLIGAMAGAGFSDEEANYLAETIRRGGAAVSVRASDSHVAAVEKIMDGAGPINAESRRAEYRREGWTGFDEQAGPYAQASWSELS
ncbi:hypothetical protein AB6806_19890 [Bosea sp. RCC_152_1]|uniref:hypothetical protein n=1 Tax=Bosea sp. RCC_152_1 TaxID=3239228 RepID=UPI003523CB9A